MDISLTYLSDTLGVTPEISGTTMVWHIPNLACYGYGRSFGLFVQLPPGSEYGELYPISLTIGFSRPDLTPADNVVVMEILALHRAWLPMVSSPNISP
jgi:hypothetical protein